MEIEKFFAKASHLGAGYLTKKEWDEKKALDGAKRFKRSVLGLFSKKTIKTIDELAKIFFDMGMVSSITEGKKLIPSLDGKNIEYGLNRVVGFDIVINSQGEKKYRIGDYQTGPLPMF